MNRKMIHIGVLLVITSFTSFSQLAYYTNISDSLYYKGEWDSSLVYARKIGNIIEKDSGKISHAFARFADQYMGWINETRGDYKQALNWYLESVETYRQIGDVHSTDYGGVINNLANLYTIIGAYNEAEKLLPIARNIFKDIPLDTSEAYGAITNNLLMFISTRENMPMLNICTWRCCKKLRKYLVKAVCSVLPYTTTLRVFTVRWVYMTRRPKRLKSRKLFFVMQEKSICGNMQ